MHEVDLIILGKVKTGPCSAYELQKDMERRNLSTWVNVSTPSVYKAVIRLEGKGYLAGSTVRESKMPEKTVYSITEEGKLYFEETLCRLAKQAVRILFPLNAVVVNLDQLPRDKALGLIGDIRGQIQSTRDYLGQALDTYAALPLVERTIIEQQLAVSETLGSWAEGFEQQFQEEFSEEEN